uniref:peroxidase n=2 Tax=Quercus lobata TaxID=97700 RepID=A0A7N2MX60_QUELO
MLLLLAIGASLVRGHKGTRVGFYSTTCPQAESIVSSTIQCHFNSDHTVAAGLLRTHFHDCFMRGCDASVLIEAAKTQLEAVCPGVVSCADILALAAHDSVVLVNGSSWAVPTGRRDGRVSLVTDADNLPAFTDSIDVQKQKFSALGLNTQDLVALVGNLTLFSLTKAGKVL